MAAKGAPAAAPPGGAPAGNSVLKTDAKDGKELPKKKFAVDLWDRFDQVFERITRGRHDMKTIKSYMETRHGLEESYGKALEKLEKVGAMQEETSLSPCFKDVKDGAGTLAKQHVQFANVCSQVAGALDKTIKEVKTTKTKLKENHAKLTTDEKNKTAAHAKARQAYADAVKQAEQATNAYKEGKRTNVLAKQLEKLKAAMKDKVKTVDATYVVYKKCAEQLKQSQETLYRETCGMLQQFEDLEMRRLTVMYEQFEKFAQQHDFLKSAIDQIAVFLHKGTDHVNIKRDIQEYIQKVCTGKDVGKWCEFVPITSAILAQDPDTNQPMTMSAPPPDSKMGGGAGASSNASKPAPPSAQPPATKASPKAEPAAAAPAAPAANNGSAEQQAQALYDFDSTEADELPFKAGDLIKVYSAPDDNDWWQGEFNGKVGIFPKAYVQLLNGEGAAAAAGGGASAASSSSSAPSGEGEGAKPNDEPKPEVTAKPTSEGAAKDAPAGAPPSAGAGAGGAGGAGDIKFMDATCDAVYDFEAQGGDELSFKAGEALIITGELNGWYLGKSKDGSRVGIFPSNYVGNVVVKSSA